MWRGDRPVPVLMAVLTILGGCAGLPAGDQEGRGDPVVPAGEGAAALAPRYTHEMHLGLVQRMLEQRLYYAALAHLDSVPGYAEDPEARWLRAEALRHTGRGGEARALYLALAQGNDPLAAQAERGLGLLAAQEQALDQALQHLRHARELAPTDARICNDLGYALMLNGQLEPARRQLATALELGDNAARSVRNYILLLIIQGDSAAAGRWARQQGIEAQELETLRHRADAIRRGWSGGESS